MKLSGRFPLLLALIPLVYLAAACSPAAASTLAPSPTASAGAVIGSPGPAASLTAAPSARPPQVLLPSAAPARTEPAPVAPTPTTALETSTPATAPTACPPEACRYANALPFARPIPPPGQDAVDVAYRFGATQGGMRDPHHGVEFLNPAGTPVLAAGAGTVVVAGDDRETFYGPYSYFYGNLVVIQHPLPDRFPRTTGPLYTLYGHLSEISVEVGQEVQSGQEIGRVGMSGVATGSHLHFEVRQGENRYPNALNPELWLAPRLEGDGQPMGALAGSIQDVRGDFLEVPNIVLEHLPAPGEPALRSYYLATYEEPALIGQPPWDESFGIGDLPAGLYRVSFVKCGMQEFFVPVNPGELTVVAWVLECRQ